MVSSPVNKLLKKHQTLNHSDNQKVRSHVQRDIKVDGVDWVLNTVIIEDCEVAFRFKRRQEYKNLQGKRVNLTYYRTTENVAGVEMEVMNVVRIKIA